VEDRGSSARAFALAGGESPHIGLARAHRAGSGPNPKSPRSVVTGPLGSHLPTVRGQFRHARPDALAITEDDMDKLLLIPTEAANALGIGRSKVYELMQTGQLQSVHIGACRRVPADAIHSFLDKLRTAASA